MDQKTTAGSPWDEPLDEEEVASKKAPTVIGDLDFNKKQNPAAAPVGAKALNIPTNVEEKVGAKVDATTIAAGQPPAPVAVPVAVAPAVPAVEKATDSGADFWQEVYSNEDNPQPTPAAPVVSADIKPAPAPIVAPAAVPVPNTMQNNVQSQQSVVEPEPSAQVPLRPNVGAKPAAPAPKPTGGGPKTGIIAAIILGALLLFAGAILLTEKGIISVGLEKAYGAVRLEALWGGLPKNPENAFAIAASQMKTDSSFKVDGTATLTTNAGVQSTIITPLISAVAYPLVSLKDESMGPKIKAVLTQMTSETDASQSLALDSTSTGSTSSTTTSGNTNASVSEVTAKIKANITDSVSGADINLSSKNKSSSEVNLVYGSNKLYVKTSSDIVYDSAAKNSWIYYDFKNFGSEPLGQKFWSSNFTDSSFSISGSRAGNEKINGVRCYHYTGTVNLGNSLTSFGLDENSVQNMDFDYWIGVSDHQIYKISAKIIPNAKYAVSRIDLELNFSDFNSDSGTYNTPATSTAASATGISSTSTVANDVVRKADLAKVATALEDYKVATGKYPIVSGTEKLSLGSSVLSRDLVPTYISAVPIDPKDPTYYYGYESNGTTYTLSAVLEDKSDAQGRNVGGKHIYFLKSQ